MAIYGKKLLNEKTLVLTEYNIQSCCSQITLFNQQWKSIYLSICVYNDSRVRRSLLLYGAEF